MTLRWNSGSAGYGTSLQSLLDYFAGDTEEMLQQAEDGPVALTETNKTGWMREWELVAAARDFLDGADD